MKVLKSFITSSIILCISSCRSTDFDNSLGGSRPSAVQINLLGTEYSGSKLYTSSKANQNKIQVQTIMLSPSNAVVTRLESVLPKTPSHASSDFISAIPGDPLPSGMKFRVIAYRQNNGDYHNHEDYTVGQTALPLMLDGGENYQIVVYSYGANSLPTISNSERNNINNAQVNYDNTNRDFMYQKINYTPDGNNPNNRLDITLNHKTSLVTTIINSVALGTINSINSASIAPHFSNATIQLSSGQVENRTGEGRSNLTFPGPFPSPIQIATPTYINADTGGTTGYFIADININGDTKTVSLPNSFSIIPGRKNNLSINLIKCGAYIAPGVWKDFMCHNLGADLSADPFTPSAAIHGAKYQWGAQTGETGRYYSQTDDQANPGSIPGWNTTPQPTDAWLDDSKTINDPCPTGYRVPTPTQWRDLINNNPNIEYIGPWGGNDDPTNFGVAVYFGTAVVPRTLMFPVAGRRRVAPNSSIGNRGSFSYYWSSSVSTSNLANGQVFFLSNGSSSINNNLPRISGLSVRCIAE